MKKLIFTTLSVAILSSCGGNTAKNSGSDSISDSTMTSTETVQTIDTVAVRAEADSIIRASLKTYYDSQKKEIETEKLSETIFTPAFIKEFSDKYTQLEKQAKPKIRSMGGLLPGVVATPYDILYDNRNEPAPDGTEYPERSKYEITDIEFDGLDKATAKVKATTIWNYMDFDSEDGDMLSERHSATVTIILIKDASGKWLIDDIEHKGLGSFRENIKKGKALRIEWFS